MTRTRWRPHTSSSRATAKTALLLEEHPAIRELLVAFLRELDCIAIPAADPEAARVIAERLPVDLAVLNLTLPSTTAGSLIAQLKSQHPSAPHVVVCAYGPPERREECRRLGADAVLPRPVSLPELEHILHGFGLEPSVEHHRPATRRSGAR